MPELPDITVYIDALQRCVVGRTLNRVRIISPFVLRTFDPPIEAVVGRRVADVTRLGKRIAIELTAPSSPHDSSSRNPPPAASTSCVPLSHRPCVPCFLLFHLMIAGRFRWLRPGAKPPGRITAAVFDFDHGTLVLTEAGTKKRASLHVLGDRAALAQHDPGGIDILDSGLPAFREVLTRENHTLKRTLTDPRIFSGIGNAYSDEILHVARLSPITLTSKLSQSEIDRLHRAACRTLQRWIDHLRAEFAHRFPGPGDITAFRPDFAVHGRFGQPCPVCRATVQRIRYAHNETNYCPRCQTGGRIVRDRSLSRLLKDDWPSTMVDDS